MPGSWHSRFFLSLTTLATAGMRVGCLGGAPEPRKKQISASGYGESWPLTVEGGKLFCIDVTKVEEFSQQAILLESGGLIYALNGSAKTAAIRENKPWIDAREITKKDPRAAEWGMNAILDITPLIEEGQTLCPEK